VIEKPPAATIKVVTADLLALERDEADNGLSERMPAGLLTDRLDPNGC
jgi:hypothetical protein